jgi:4'-phosphopantetheinyl transferase
MQLVFSQIDDGPRPLDAGEVHVWSASMERCCDPSLLTPDEQVRASRLKVERVRHRFIASRVQLRIVLGRYLDLAPPEVPLTYEASGKPVLHSSCPTRLHFNVTHSGSVAIYAVSASCRVGVDVELQNELQDADALVERFFASGDRQIYSTLPPWQRLFAFYRAWTRKEAVLKAVGKGVQWLDYCEVTFRLGEPEAVLRLGDDSDCRAKWLLRSWEPAAYYVAAVAVELPLAAAE